jgi:hypothetical protein
MPKKMPTFEAVVDAVWNKHITKLGGQGDEFRTSVWRFLVDRYDLSESEAKALRKKVMDQLENEGSILRLNSRGNKIAIL